MTQEHEDASSPDAPAESAVEEWIKRNFNWLALLFMLSVIVLPRVVPFEPLQQWSNLFERVSEWVLAKLETLFKDYGYYVVFFGVLMENSLFLGLLVPGAIILILAGLAAENGAINVWYVLGLGIVATILGDTISYGIGRLGWTRLLERGIMREAMDRVRGTMESNQVWIILAYHFAGYSRVVGPTAAGLFRIPFRTWAPLDYMGGAAWVVTYTLVGVLFGLFGVEFGETKQTVRLLEWVFTLAIIVAIAWAFYRSSRQKPDETRVALKVDDEQARP